MTGRAWIAALDGELWSGVSRLDLLEIDQAEYAALSEGVLRLRDVRGRRLGVVDVSPEGSLSLRVVELDEVDA